MISAIFSKITQFQTLALRGRIFEILLGFWRVLNFAEFLAGGKFVKHLQNWWHLAAEGKLLSLGALFLVVCRKPSAVPSKLGPVDNKF